MKIRIQVSSEPAGAVTFPFEDVTVDLPKRKQNLPQKTLKRIAKVLKQDLELMIENGRLHR